MVVAGKHSLRTSKPCECGGTLNLIPEAGFSVWCCNRCEVCERVPVVQKPKLYVERVCVFEVRRQDNGKLLKRFGTEGEALAFVKGVK